MLCLCKLVWLQFKNSWTEWHLIISPRVSTWQLLTCTRKNIVICQGQKLSKKGERFFTRSTVMHFSLLTGGLKIWSSYFGRNLLEIWTRLRWLITVSSTFQEEDFDGSLLPLFITSCYNHGIKILLNHRWTRWYNFRDTIGYHSNTMTC